MCMYVHVGIPVLLLKNFLLPRGLEWWGERERPPVTGSPRPAPAVSALGIREEGLPSEGAAEAFGGGLS